MIYTQGSYYVVKATFNQNLALKAPITSAADDILKCFFFISLVFKENKAIFHLNFLLSR